MEKRRPIIEKPRRKNDWNRSEKRNKFIVFIYQFMTFLNSKFPFIRHCDVFHFFILFYFFFVLSFWYQSFFLFFYFILYIYILYFIFYILFFYLKQSFTLDLWLFSLRKGVQSDQKKILKDEGFWNTQWVSFFKKVGMK